MKNIIVIIFTIVLGVYIGMNFIMGDGDNGISFQRGAEIVSEKASSEFLKISDYNPSEL